jgi:hypothetical protein
MVSATIVGAESLAIPPRKENFLKELTVSDTDLDVKQTKPGRCIVVPVNSMVQCSIISDSIRTCKFNAAQTPGQLSMARSFLTQFRKTVYR